MQMADESQASVPISREPVRTLHLPYKSARRLALLPRNKYHRESTAAGFAGTIAALPSAINAAIQAVQRNTFGLGIFETLQVLICFGFLVWLVVSLVYSREEQTSVEYLDELYAPSGSAVNPTAASSTP